MGVAEDGRFGRRPVRGRGRPDLARQRHRGGPRHGQPRPPRRPAAARPTAPGHPSAGGRPVGARARPRRRGDDAARPAGLFLENTWRLHPDLCAFTSEVFYEDRLEPEPTLARQRVERRSGASPTGRDRGCSRCRRSGRTTSRPDEARRWRPSPARSSRAGRPGWTDWATRHRVGWEDILIVAPYNAQVGEIRRRLPPAARVGTVDKFQGQEAPISIYSMTTSSPELAPRGMDFLYSRHRLNVATSRARCVGRRRRLARPVPGARPDARADAPGQRVLPVRGDGPRVAGPGRATGAPEAIPVAGDPPAGDLRDSDQLA